MCALGQMSAVEGVRPQGSLYGLAGGGPTARVWSCRWHTRRWKGSSARVLSALGLKMRAEHTLTAAMAARGSAVGETVTAPKRFIEQAPGLTDARLAAENSFLNR